MIQEFPRALLPDRAPLLNTLDLGNNNLAAVLTAFKHRLCIVLRIVFILFENGMVYA